MILNSQSNQNTVIMKTYKFTRHSLYLEITLRLNDRNDKSNLNVLNDFNNYKIDFELFFNLLC